MLETEIAIFERPKTIKTATKILFEKCSKEIRGGQGIQKSKIKF